MKAFLMYKGRDFDVKAKLPSNEAELIQDLELSTLIGAMAGKDEFVASVAKTAILSGINLDAETILYRQAILRDCLANPAVIRTLYDVAVGQERQAKSSWNWFGNYPTATLNRSVDILETLVERLRDLRQVADKHVGRFESEGLSTLFKMLKAELGEEYLATIVRHLKRLKFRDGMLMSAQLGAGNKGSNYVLRTMPVDKRNWFERFFGLGPKPEEYKYSFTLPPRDDAGARALGDLNDRGINLVANAASHSADHIISFFEMLRTELAFYIGGMNLYERLIGKGEPTTFPVALPASQRSHRFEGLFDVCLSVHLNHPAVGNDADLDDKTLILVTGANQGGKSTFLRSVGLAQLMMQCGMFVPATSFAANLCDGLFTHYKREEDNSMKSGKLDEELSRMSIIVDHLTENSLVLFNESFAATNEREGSEIAELIVDALLEKRIKMVFVTHMYEFAHAYVTNRNKGVTFLRAERQDDGTRTFKLVEGEPLRTSYGQDLYKTIFAGRKDTKAKKQPERRPTINNVL